MVLTIGTRSLEGELIVLGAGPSVEYAQELSVRDLPRSLSGVAVFVLGRQAHDHLVVLHRDVPLQQTLRARVLGVLLECVHDTLRVSLIELDGGLEGGRIACRVILRVNDARHLQQELRARPFDREQVRVVGWYVAESRTCLSSAHSPVPGRPGALAYVTERATMPPVKSTWDHTCAGSALSHCARQKRWLTSIVLLTESTMMVLVLCCASNHTSTLTMGVGSTGPLTSWDGLTKMGENVPER